MTSKNWTVLSAGALFWWAVPALAGGDGSRTYICVEERSAGWERLESGEYNIGKFKPSEGKFFVRFRPQKWTEAGANRYLVLPQIEITDDGNSSSYRSTACDEIGKSSFLPYDGPARDKACEGALNSSRAKLQFFGSEMKNYQFIPPLSEGAQATTYTSSMIFGLMGAWLSGGSCVLAD